MSLKTLIIHKNKILHNILKEISEIINFKIAFIEEIELNIKEFKNYIVITNKKIPELKNQLVINNLPLSVNKLVEIINISFLKQEYSTQSNVNIGMYELNLNSRILSYDNINLDLTEMETNLILFLQQSSAASNVKKLQKKVWGHVPDLETHTVETHIYRLRKKIKDKFKDDNFIKSLKDGYKIT